jgi:hypothetical protein
MSDSKLCLIKLNLIRNLNILGKLEIMNPGQEDFKNDNEPFSYPCNCLPDCINCYYPIQSSESTLDMVIYKNKDLLKYVLVFCW